MSIAHFRDKEGYMSSWYDVVGDPKENYWHDFFFEMEEKSGDIYVSVETYSQRIVPANELCLDYQIPLQSFILAARSRDPEK